jgi:2-dehydropantoate 2-reductase
VKICVVGAGAIGGLVAAKLAALGHEVSIVVRGPHLAAIRERGLTLQEDGTERTFRVGATDKMAELGVQDLVIIGLKAHQVAGVAADIRGLCGPTTIVVTAQNGIPWWYFFKTGRPYQGTVLESGSKDG